MFKMVKQSYHSQDSIALYIQLNLLHAVFDFLEVLEGKNRCICEMRSV